MTSSPSLKWITPDPTAATTPAGSWPTIEGNLSWDAYGSPNGDDLLVEWVGGKLLPVFPAKVALAKPFSPKRAWGG